MNLSPTQTFVLASNIDPSADSGISNGAQAWVGRFAPDARVEHLGNGWRLGRVAELLRLRRLLVEQLDAGAPCVIEGYKAALFCFSALGRLRRAPKNQLTFLIHDAGSTSHLRIARFWAARLSLRAVYRLYRATLDLLIERLILAQRPVVVVSQAEAAKINFTDAITVEPPPGAPVPASTTSAPNAPTLALTENDLMLYADLRVAHLRRSTLDSLRYLRRQGITLPHRLVLLGRRPAPRAIARLAGGVFKGGLLDLVYVTDLPLALRSAGATWLPDLVGSGVKNRTLDALRHSPLVISSEVALEGISPELMPDSTRLHRYASLAELPSALR